ncbi:rhomboid family intramembrane serine protease [Gordonia sp. HY002]|nr:rhomboid family intramembrane serine protease [Gordonia zhenghanii]MCF8569369.1 rhomboid family intramembrane serine protease [Gordonia zhenghanii]MCF8603626.1 rhomboid family intramembrane serine protease [Gordonia zhenghanii]
MQFAVELLDVVLDGRLDTHGIEPRTWSGLLGVIWAPFLHADFAHLISNLLPGLVLGFFVLLSGRALVVTGVVWVVSGVGVWLTAPSASITVGASGIVFGWLTFLIVRGLFNRDVWQVLGGVVIAVIYGGILWGVLPGTSGVSWQGHLFGAVGGVLAAWMVATSAGAEKAGGTKAIELGGLS